MSNMSRYSHVRDGSHWPRPPQRPLQIAAATVFSSGERFRASLKSKTFRATRPPLRITWDWMSTAFALSHTTQGMCSVSISALSPSNLSLVSVVGTPGTAESVWYRERFPFARRRAFLSNSCPQKAGCARPEGKRSRTSRTKREQMLTLIPHLHAACWLQFPILHPNCYMMKVHPVSFPPHCVLGSPDSVVLFLAYLPYRQTTFSFGTWQFRPSGVWHIHIGIPFPVCPLFIIEPCCTISLPRRCVCSGPSCCVLRGSVPRIVVGLPVGHLLRELGVS